jgi:hypothetical protein
MTLDELTEHVAELVEHVHKMAENSNTLARSTVELDATHRATRDDVSDLYCRVEALERAALHDAIVNDTTALTDRVAATELRHIKLTDRVYVLEAAEPEPDDNERIVTWLSTVRKFPSPPEPEGYEEYLDRQERLDNAVIDKAWGKVHIDGHSFRSAVILLKYIRTGKV